MSKSNEVLDLLSAVRVSPGKIRTVHVDAIEELPGFSREILIAEDGSVHLELHPAHLGEGGASVVLRYLTFETAVARLEEFLRLPVGRWLEGGWDPPLDRLRWKEGMRALRPLIEAGELPLPMGAIEYETSGYWE